MERELGRTQNVVASLRSMLAAGRFEVAVDHRFIAGQTTLLIRDRVHRADIQDWCHTSYDQLYGVLAQAQVAPAGPAGATYDAAFSECDRTYGAIGSHVAEHDRALPGPIREIYLVGPTDTHQAAGLQTEVCWPIAA